MPLMFFLYSKNPDSHAMFTYYEKNHQGCIAAKGSNYRLTKCTAVHSVHYITQTTFNHGYNCTSCAQQNATCKLVATLHGSRPGEQSASLIMTS